MFSPPSSSSSTSLFSSLSSCFESESESHGIVGRRNRETAESVARNKATITKETDLRQSVNDG